MSMVDGTPAYRFSDFTLDPANRRLTRAGVEIYLQPKAFDTLLFLVEHDRTLVTKRALLDAVWPETAVTDNALTQQISELRESLDDDARQPRFIRTVPRIGFTFIAPVDRTPLRIEGPGTARAVSSDPETAADAPGSPSSAVAERLDGTLVSFPTHEQSEHRGRWLVPWLTAAIVGTGVALVVLVFLAADAPEPRIIAVTSFPGLERFPSISPDGNFVAFTWTGPNPQGVPDLWIKEVEGDARRRLTETPEGEGPPAWSPDGRQIAFPRGGRGVFVVPVLGGAERKVADAGSHVGWTRDGRSLLIRAPGARPQSFAIYRIDLATGQRTQLTASPEGIGDFTFDVSPDGETLAFVRFDRPGVSDIYVAPLSGGAPTRRTDWNRSISRVVWTPDGRNLVFAVADPPALGQSLFRIPAAGARLERGTRALHVNGMFPSLSSASAARVAFHTLREDIGLRLLDLHGPRSGGVVQSLGPIVDSSRIDVPGPFSKDGGRITFVSDRSGSPQLWAANRDGSALRQVTRLQAVEIVAGAWSPDERQIVIDATVDGNSDIYVIDAEDGRARRLTTEPSLDTYPSWSGDGRWIYFNSTRSGTVEVWKAPADGGAAVRVTQHGGVQAKEVPGSRSLFYLDRPPLGAGGMSQPGTLKHVPTDGGGEVAVLDRVRFGLWSVTDEGIVFLTVERDFDALDFYAFSDRRVRRLGQLPERVSRIAGYAQLRTSRDGRWAMINVTDHLEGDVMVADGFR
jgi:Tol biopolymer transport system component/DNA-binding winged helix-turn-helix (wHTH) protein